MITAKELVELINASDEVYAPFVAKELFEQMNDAKEIATQEYDEHRWYTCATVVYQIGNEFFGIFGPVSLKSKEMGYKDIEYKCEAFEMETVPSVTYKRKV